MHILLDTSEESVARRRRSGRPTGGRTATLKRASTALTVYSFGNFEYLSDKIPERHRKTVAKVAEEIMDGRARNVLVIGHAFGSTMERKYTLGFRRALRVARAVRDRVLGQGMNLERFPRIMVASFGDTFPRMGKTEAQDRRVDVVFRRSR